MPSFRKEYNLNYKRLCLIILKYDTKSIKSFKYLLGIFMKNYSFIMRSEIYIIGSEYIKEIDILTSMKGISVMTAIAIIAEIVTIDRFPNSKHFTSYLRSAPGVDSSNETNPSLPK